jgi:hypothetical protein
MPIRRPARLPSEQDIERVIEGGSPPAHPQPDLSKDGVRFAMAVPAPLCTMIDEARKLTKTSRRAWLLQAAQEKLEREGRLR